MSNETKVSAEAILAMAERVRTIAGGDGSNVIARADAANMLEVIAAERTRAEGEAVELIEADKALDAADYKMRSLLRAGPRPHSYGTGWEVRDEAYKRKIMSEIGQAEKRRAKALAAAIAAHTSHSTDPKGGE